MRGTILALSTIASAGAFVVPALRAQAPPRASHVCLDGSDLPEDFGDFDMGLLKCALRPPLLPTMRCSRLPRDADHSRSLARRLTRMVTPQQAQFEKYRQRQQERTGQNMMDKTRDSMADLVDSGPKKTPLGLDPVDPFDEPVDLTKVMGDGETGAPTPEQIAEANANFDDMVNGPVPDGFADGLEGFFDGQ